MPPVTFGLTRAFLACGSAAASAVHADRWKLPDAHTAKRNEILDFWFGEGWKQNPPKITNNYELWFGGSAEIDKTINDKFAADVKKARDGEYSKWATAGPLECLALIILLDQFALNVYREKPDGYLSSEAAIPIAYTAIARGYPRQINPDGSITALPSPMRMFFYLPLMHSELLQDQEVCVQKYREMGEDEGDKEGGTLEFAILHRDIVAKYGRFPGRNKCMGRTSNAEEEKYLAEGGIF